MKFWIGIITLCIFSLQSCRTSNPNGAHGAQISLIHLNEQLDAQNWRAADTETFQLLLKISDRTSEGWLTQDDIADLDCQVLLEINQTWADHSERKFSFAQQHQRWRSAGGTVGQYHPEIAEKFGDLVGWRAHGQWRDYEDLTFSLQAPKGHLPATTGNGVSGGIWGGVATLSQRFQYCQYVFGISQAREDYYADCENSLFAQDDLCQLKQATEHWGETPNWSTTGLPTLINRLEYALSQQRWIDADRITKIILDHYRHANHAEFDKSANHDVIPCYLLEAVDALWMNYSQGHFGLSAQGDVLDKQQTATANQGRPTTEAMRKAFGWPQHWRFSETDVYNPAFDQVKPQQIPKGFYPFYMGYSFGTYGSGYLLSWRLYLDPTCGF